MRLMPGVLLAILLLSLAVRLPAQSLTGDRAVGRQRTEGLKAPGATATPRTLWVILIDVGTYWDPAIASIPATENDATALEAVFRAMPVPNKAFDRCFVRRYSSRNAEVKTLRQYVPNRSVLMELFEDRQEGLRQRVQAGDQVLLFFSGHGLTYQGDMWILPYDAKPGAYKSTAIRLQQFDLWIEALEEIGARVVLFLDACRNEVLTAEEGTRSGTGVSGAMSPEFARMLAIGRGSARFSSAREGQYAQEGLFPDPLGGGGTAYHGLFSAFTIAGLLGKADANGDGYVLLSELHRYTDSGMRNFINSRQELRRQEPALTLKDVTGEIALIAVPPRAAVQQAVGSARRLPEATSAALAVAAPESRGTLQPDPFAAAAVSGVPSGSPGAAGEDSSARMPMLLIVLLVGAVLVMLVATLTLLARLLVAAPGGAASATASSDQLPAVSSRPSNPLPERPSSGSRNPAPPPPPVQPLPDPATPMPAPARPSSRNSHSSVPREAYEIGPAPTPPPPTPIPSGKKGLAGGDVPPPPPETLFGRPMQFPPNAPPRDPRGR